ncbi:aspartate 1-decarboxylase [Ensifer sp. PDNC004]|nr:aspartate 1-decarboxylase [Ensifer sp. PDNC004]
MILGERGSRCCILNGAAARTCQPGDQVIICNSVYLDESRITSLKPTILTFDESNHVRDRLSYAVSIDDEGRHTFEILDEASNVLPIPLLVTNSPERLYAKAAFPTNARAIASVLREYYYGTLLPGNQDQMSTTSPDTNPV